MTLNHPTSTDHPTSADHPTRSFTLDSVSWDDSRAVELRRQMDAEMTVRYSNPGAPPEPAELTARRTAALAVNPADVRATVLVIDSDGTAIGHAVLRELRGAWEVKRVIVAEGTRGRGIGRALMARLEEIARSAGVDRLILQTGNRQPDAVALYEKIGYTPIPIYEPYIETIPFSLCYEKTIAV